MPSGVKDIQLLELKDTILQLNNTIREQSSLIENLQKLLEERNAADAKKDQIISNLEAQLEFLKQKLFGSTSESRKAQCPGQMSIFDLVINSIFYAFKPLALKQESQFSFAVHIPRPLTFHCRLPVGKIFVRCSRPICFSLTYPSPR